MSQTNTSTFSTENFKKIIAFLIAIVTVFIAIATYLQNDAGSRDDAANRDAKNYSLEALGKQVSGDAQVNFDYNQAYQAYYEYELLAIAAENAGDSGAAQRYTALMDKMAKLSPMLQAPYFDPESGNVDVARYEADTYLVATTALAERFASASDVKDAWDSKANTYIIHLTFFAVALFLYGMSTTLSGRWSPWIFSAVGTGISLFALGWMLTLFLKPVPDLRNCKSTDGTFAIDAYAEGVGLAHQERFEEAIAQFDKALQCEPKYINALIERGNAKAALGDLGPATSDYEAARAAGANNTNLLGELGYTYYLLGRFNDATAANQAALAMNENELWIRFDEGLNLLAAGKMDEAQKAYQLGMQNAAKQVADAQSAGKAPDSWLWWGLEDAAEGLDDLLDTIENDSGLPARQAIIQPEQIQPIAEALIFQLKSLSASLEYSGKPSADPISASLSELVFAEPVYAEDGTISDYEVGDTFENGVDELAIQFDYSGMKDGQILLFKVYLNGEEDPSWRFEQNWDLGAEGTAEIPLSLAYSNVSVLDAGEYTVEIYLDYQLATRGWFTVAE
ncbi:MAG TPA: hypothetical protein PK299_04975 [Anaerolineales bacterium]|nr:hypothetical protein [Anaerolineales bacterium]